MNAVGAAGMAAVDVEVGEKATGVEAEAKSTDVEAGQHTQLTH